MLVEIVIWMMMNLGIAGRMTDYGHCGMKKVTLLIGPDAERELRSAALARFMSGNAYGAVDEISKKIVTALDAGLEEVVLKTKRDREREAGAA